MFDRVRNKLIDYQRQRNCPIRIELHFVDELEIELALGEPADCVPTYFLQIGSKINVLDIWVVG